jgi:hypothetical protein
MVISFPQIFIAFALKFARPFKIGETTANAKEKKPGTAPESPAREPDADRHRVDTGSTQGQHRANTGSALQSGRFNRDPGRTVTPPLIAL